MTSHSSKKKQTKSKSSASPRRRTNLGGGQGRNRTADTRIFSHSLTPPSNTHEAESHRNSTGKPSGAAAFLPFAVGKSSTEPLHGISTLQLQWQNKALVSMALEGTKDSQSRARPYGSERK